jgi:hypothetical protein
MTCSLDREKATMKSKKQKGIAWRACAILYPVFSILIITTGCVKDTKPVAAVDKTPLIVDEAMQARDWPRTTVRFQNGETPAAPTGFILQHSPDAPKWTPILTDGPMFLANTLLMPVGYLFTPPWTRVIYPAGVAEPSYTAIPPIPPER